MRTWLVGLALVSALVLPAAAAGASELAAPPGSAESLVLAVEEDGEPAGPEPRPADDEDNPFAPGDYDRPWTWWLGVAIFVPTVLVIGLGALVYYLLVYRPRQGSEQESVRR